MIKTLIGVLFKLQSALLVELQKEIRNEADYIARVIGDGIRLGFEEGFTSVKNDFFKLMIALSSTIFGILLVSYGAAIFIDTQLSIPGVGFLIVGLIALILGLFLSIKE
ncbi:MAG: hypothetical protein B6U97_04270 [Candidatus Altiarchaeales archaeon ex4484_96]|nr:MAG: hypothetical protein B6U97_04270 [Candidatus Altiarchaeales archaeon ex4484_96]